MNNERGFTLLEVVAVTFVIAALLAGTVFLFRPRDLGVANRNAQRTRDTAHIVQALARYTAAHGRLPEGLDTTPLTIGNQDENEFDLCLLLVPAHLKDMPLDPATGWLFAEDTCMSEDAVYSTGYTIARSADGGITVAAPATEGANEIRVSRKF